MIGVLCLVFFRVSPRLVSSRSTFVFLDSTRLVSHGVLFFFYIDFLSLFCLSNLGFPILQSGLSTPPIPQSLYFLLKNSLSNWGISSLIFISLLYPVSPPIQYNP